MSKPSTGPAPQRGAALLTAMIIVTLIATLASAMVWQQWRAVQIESAERARVESGWVLLGALDWARLILAEDARGGNANTDNLTEPWAKPLEEARLSTFLAADKQNPSDDDGPEAFLSGSISDAQATYDLLNLVNNNPAKPEDEGTRKRDQFAILLGLCERLGLSNSVAEQIDDGIRAAGAAQPAADAPLMPARPEQLTWFGVDPASVAVLAPYVNLISPAVPVNVNTAPREVLAALSGKDLATAERLAQQRLSVPFATLDDFAKAAGYTLVADTIGVKTQYFIVRGRLRLADHVLEQRSLVMRSNNGKVTMVSTERVASTDAAVR
ncbi:MAG: type II secretion system minor pseudopilin GspK [Proteobacteria bacterium]|nr:type II secretion system minor pseudopilin GspK [Pseudomonadota bacterium]